MTEAALSLGSNLGDRTENIKKAINSIGLIPATHIIKISEYYETEPFKTPSPQNKYINCCVKINTDLNSDMLLGACLGIEAGMERIRKYALSPRNIDIDLIVYGNEFKNENHITLPHPRTKERAFVLAPLRDISKNLRFGNLDFSKEFQTIDFSTIRKIDNFSEL